jgi:hypothetical protein
MKDLLRHVREIRIVYQIRDGLDSPFVQTFFDGVLTPEGQKILKSPDPINPKTNKPYSAQNLYNLHFRQIADILIDAKLDGGGVTEQKGDGEWSACFVIKDRQPKHVG